MAARWGNVLTHVLRYHRTQQPVLTSFPLSSLRFFSLLPRPSILHSPSALVRPHLPRCLLLPLSSLSVASLPISPVRGIKHVARKKLKSHSGSKKRFRFTRNGLIMRWRAGKSHKAWTKSSSRLRRLSRPVPVYKGHVSMIKRSLPYGWKHSR